MSRVIVCSFAVVLSSLAPCGMSTVNAQIFRPSVLPPTSSAWYGGNPYGGAAGYGGVWGGGVWQGGGVYPALPVAPSGPWPITGPTAGYVPQVPPRSTLIQRQVVPAAPLPPATILLTHRRNETLIVTVYDRQRQQSVYRGELPPGRSAQVTLPRDAGGVVHETYQTVGPWGDLVQRQITRDLPVEVRYEVTVHRYDVQSIAIDRTGKSPSPIEDIQYQGKGLGRFVLPPGRQLQDGQVDVYRTAVSAQNEGAVAPILPPAANAGPTSDPLRQAIEELRR